jgi:hypothetical protein
LPDPCLQYFALSPASAYNHDDVLLMDAEEFARSEDFANSQILPRIHQDWLTNDAALLTEWLQRSERYRPPVSVAEQWHAMYTEALAKVQQEEEGVREVGKRRIMQVWRYRTLLD